MPLLLIVTGIGVLFGIINAPSANAWAPIGTMPELSANLEEKLDSTFTGTRYENWRTMNYAMGDYDGSTFLFVIRDNGQPVVTDGGTDMTSLNGSVCRWNNSLTSPGCNAFTQDQGISTSTLYSMHLTDTFATDNPSVYGEYQAQYPSLIEDGGGEIPSEVTYDECTALDFACYFGNVMKFFVSIGDFISGFFTSFGEMFTDFSLSVVDGISSLFMPTVDFGAAFNDLRDFFNSKFGFLVFPIDFIGRLLTAMMPSNPGGTVASCGSTNNVPQFCLFSVGPILGSYMTIDFGFAEKYFPAFFDLARTALAGLLSVGLIIALHKKYMGVIKS